MISSRATLSVVKAMSSADDAETVWPVEGIYAGTQKALVSIGTVRLPSICPCPLLTCGIATLTYLQMCLAALTPLATRFIRL